MFLDIINSINKSPNKGIHGLIPFEVDKGIDGVLAIKLAQQKFGETYLLSKNEQLKYKKEFYSHPQNKLLKIGQFVLVDISISKRIRKGHTLNRGQICRIKDIDWSARPVLFTLQSYSEKKILPIRFYQEQLKILLGNPKNIDKRFQAILQQRHGSDILFLRQNFVVGPKNRKKVINRSANHLIKI